MSDNGNKPVTRAELQAALTATKNELRDELMEAMRQIETNLLTAFHGYARGVSAHLHTLDATANDLNVRMASLEDRVLSLETRRPV